jgi:hypothetical protein
MSTNLPAIAAKTNSNLSHVERIVNHRDNRIMKLGFQSAYSQVYNLITVLFPLYGIDGAKEYYMEVLITLLGTTNYLHPKRLKLHLNCFLANS